MNREEVYKKLQDILVKDLKIDENKVKADTSFYEELGMDSISVVEFYASVEESFGIEIDSISKFVNSMKTFQNMVEYVCDKMNISK